MPPGPKSRVITFNPHAPKLGLLSDPERQKIATRFRTRLLCSQTKIRTLNIPTNGKANPRLAFVGILVITNPVLTDHQADIETVPIV